MKKHLLSLLAALTLFALLAPMGVSAQGNSQAAHNCQQGGYVNWSSRAGGPPFATAAECVSSQAKGGSAYPAPSISSVREGASDIYGDQAGSNIRYCFFWTTYYNFNEANPPIITYYHDGVYESTGSYTFHNGVRGGDIVPFGVTQVIVATDRQTGEVLVTGSPQVCEAAA